MGRNSMGAIYLNVSVMFSSTTELNQHLNKANRVELPKQASEIG